MVSIALSCNGKFDPYDTVWYAKYINIIIRFQPVKPDPESIFFTNICKSKIHYYVASQFVNYNQRVKYYVFASTVLLFGIQINQTVYLAVCDAHALQNLYIKEP